MRKLTYLFLLTLCFFMLSVPSRAFGHLQSSGEAGYALRFYGHGVDQIDRVKINLDAPETSVDVGGDFTIEFWIKANLGDNTSGTCATGGDAWTSGNTIIDRDIFGAGDYGDFGISLYGGKIAFGVANATTSQSICSAAGITNATWQHVAVTRTQSSGLMQIFLDGVLQASAIGPTGDISYRNGRSTSYSQSDPFLVFGAEKHDYDSVNYPSFNGLLDEVRISNIVRYTGNFTRPTTPFTADAYTVGLYHFDEGPAGPCNGTTLDSSGFASHGACLYGGAGTAGPLYVADTIFTAEPTATPTVTLTPTATIPPLLSAPKVPRTMFRLLTNDATPTLTWFAVNGAVEYEITVASDKDFTNIILTDSVLTLFYMPIAALPDGVYYWRVRALNTLLQPGKASFVQTLTIDTTPPPIPTLTSPMDGAVLRRAPILRWARVPNAVLYEAQVSASVDFSSPTTYRLRASSRPLSALADGVYYWRVRAQDSAGNWSGWAAYRQFEIDR